MAVATPTQVVIKSRAAKQACTHNVSRETIWTRNMEGVRFFGIGGNRSAWSKPSKAGMQSANQVHILTILVKGKRPGTKPVPASPQE